MLMGALSYSLVIFFNTMLYRKLSKTKKRMSNRTLEGQRQLSLVLKYQALVPLVICVIPLTLVFIFCALGTRTRGKGTILTLLVTWIPVMNSMSTIIFIKHYRRFLVRSTIRYLLCFRRIYLMEDTSGYLTGAETEKENSTLKAVFEVQNLI